MCKRRMSAIALTCLVSLIMFTVSSFADASYDRTGYANTYTNAGNYATDLVNVALTQVGYHEDPTSPDYTKYSNWYFGTDTEYAWCGIFISWCADQAGIPQNIIHKNKHVYGTNYESYAEQTAEGDYFGGTPYAFGSPNPAPGDLFFSTTQAGYDGTTHVGIIWKVDSNYIYTLEGNTHFKDSNGNSVGYVATRMYDRKTGYQYYESSNTTSSYVHILFYVHPDYEYTKNVSALSNTVQESNDNMTFIDVSSDSYYADAVQWCAEKGITKGTTENMFSPNQSCTRGQTATFLYRYSATDMQIEDNSFSDVSRDSYFYYPITWCAWADITYGTTATTFSPQKTVTRAEFLTMLYRYSGCPAVTTGSSFSDVPENAYYADAVSWAVQNEITYGVTNSEFKPYATCTRAQIAAFLYRYARSEHYA